LKIELNELSAIGQFLVAIATFTASYVALKQSKPSVKVTAKVMQFIQTFNTTDIKAKKIEGKKLMITVTNVGNVPVNIINIDMKMPNKIGTQLSILPQPNTIPKILMPSEQVSTWTELSELEKYGLKDYEICCAYDSSGRVYYCHVKLIKWIKRYFWWKFGNVKDPV
jgi:hypothetical protein